MNLRSLDLNLLVAFDALFAERNVTRAADKIGLSQPAFSNALARLRAALKDDLFIRMPDGMKPTPVAEEIAIGVHDALATLQQTLDPPKFDPKTAQRTFRIESNDYLIAAYLPSLLALLAKEAPGIDLRFTPTTGRTQERLDQQEIDFGVSAFGDLPERFAVQNLAEDSYVCLVRKRHELTQGKMTLQRFAACSHLLVSPRGDSRGFIDTALAEKGMTRRVGVVINQFSAAPALIAASNMVLTVPKRIADL
jgi:DNA-binding transcriptional LysR family regulator